MKPNFQLREGQGSLFRTDKADGNAPDFAGDILIGGKLHKINGWIKQNRDGPSYQSVSSAVMSRTTGGTT
jgi:hypothetical protein